MSIFDTPVRSTRAQTKFLRLFLTNPAGPPPEAWPSPVILRRWLKKKGFRQALSQLQDAYRHVADLQLSSAAAHAAGTLQHCFSHPDQIKNQKSEIENALRLLRLHHIRLRFPLPEPPAPDRKIDTKPQEPKTESALLLQLLRRHAYDRRLLASPDDVADLDQLRKKLHNVP